MVAVQALIKERLPQALADPDNKMQTAAGMAIAVIVKYEFPDGWPQLLPSLVQAITARHSFREGAYPIKKVSSNSPLLLLALGIMTLQGPSSLQLYCTDLWRAAEPGCHSQEAAV